VLVVSVVATIGPYYWEMLTVSQCCSARDRHEEKDFNIVDLFQLPT